MPVLHRKLVRDRIPAIIRADGGHPVTRVLDEGGYRQALLDKLAEEAEEAARASPADFPGELADVLEVLRALTAAAGMSWEQLLTLADDKRNRRGGFDGKIFLESVQQDSDPATQSRRFF
jgi:predicted house-cleaning noncanonical NTP pyrophosphatase (MazG superfamily)